MFQIVEAELSGPIIKVVGVGGAGAAGGTSSAAEAGLDEGTK